MRRALATVIVTTALAVAGCAGDDLIRIPAKDAPGAGATPTAPVPIASDAVRPPASPGTPLPPVSPERGNSIQPDLVCSAPQENYDIFGAVAARFGVEASARLRQLFATNFKSSSLTKKDREMLKFVARETLWIPPWLESRIGDALFAVQKDRLKPIPPELDSVKQFGAEVLTRIVQAAPKMPYDIQLLILEEGTPQGIGGGRIIVERDTVVPAMQRTAKPDSRDKLAFLYAHELAHIYKRHYAKMLQERLVSMDEARKLVGLLLNRTQSLDTVRAVVETTMSLDAIVQGLRKQNAEFLRSQEVEADACASALLLDSGLGNPLLGFDAYARERKGDSASSVEYAEHPPDRARREVIAWVANSGKSRKPMPLDDVRRNLRKHIADAAKRDR